MSLIKDYLQQIKQLLPRGDLWSSLGEDPTFTGYLEAEVAEKARIHSRALNLLTESDPRTTYELLPEWEAWAGLPDPCVGEVGNIEQRNNGLHAKLTMKGRQSRAYFVELAATYGYAITITEFDLFDVNSTVDERLYSAPWQYVWQVNAPAETVTHFNVLSDVNTPLAQWGNALLECVITRYKPAHTTVLFAYGD